MRVWKQALFLLGERGVRKNFPEFFWRRGRRGKVFRGGKWKFGFGVVLGVSIDIYIYICL